MTSISRINTTITDHSVISSTIAVCVIALGVITWNTAAYQNGDIAKTYDNLLQPFTASQTPTNETTARKAQATPQTSTTSLTLGKTTPLSLQNQPSEVVTDLQPAQTTTLGSTISVSNLQPSTGNVQLTSSANIQDATTSIQ